MTERYILVIMWRFAVGISFLLMLQSEPHVYLHLPFASCCQPGMARPCSSGVFLKLPILLTLANSVFMLILAAVAISCFFHNTSDKHRHEPYLMSGSEAGTSQGLEDNKKSWRSALRCHIRTKTLKEFRAGCYQNISVQEHKLLLLFEFYWSLTTSL